MPFNLQADSGLPFKTVDNGDGTVSLVVTAEGNVLSSLAVFGQAKLTGDVTLSASGGATLQESGNNIIVHAPNGGVVSVAASGGAPIAGAVVLSGAGGTTVSESGQTIQVSTIAPDVNPTSNTLAERGTSGILEAQEFIAASGTAAVPAFAVSTGAGYAGFLMGANGLTHTYNSADVFDYTDTQLKTNVRLNFFVNSFVTEPMYWSIFDSRTGPYAIGTGHWGWTSNGTQIVDYSASGIGCFGDFATKTAGKGIQIKEGANARMGIDTLSSGSVVVLNTSVTSNTRIFLTNNNPSGTVGTPYVSSIVPASAFVISSSSGDNSGIAWMLVEPS